MPSNCRSQCLIWFQLAPVWSTISKSLIPKWPESPTHSVGRTARRAHFAPHVFCREHSASTSEVEVGENVRISHADSQGIDAQTHRVEREGGRSLTCAFRPEETETHRHCLEGRSGQTRVLTRAGEAITIRLRSTRA
jgi:hypothetical protein